VAQQAEQLVRAELALGAGGAIEDDLWRLVVIEPRLPTSLVSWQPARLALGTAGDDPDTFDVHFGRPKFDGPG
jgi:hypothetical protein